MNSPIRRAFLSASIVRSCERLPEQDGLRLINNNAKTKWYESFKSHDILRAESKYRRDDAAKWITELMIQGPADPSKGTIIFSRHLEPRSEASLDAHGQKFEGTIDSLNIGQLFTVAWHLREVSRHVVPTYQMLNS